MKLQSILVSGLALGGAVLLLAPERSLAFAKNGSKLNLNQRDVRVFDNFADVTANNNITPHPMFPGKTGAEMAIWKGIVEWGSGPHGDGSGDPLGLNVLGSGGANFDSAWMGNAAAVGTTNQNIFSTIPSCSGGVLAFTELPSTDGWRIRVCDNWTWDDGPGGVQNRWDLQSVSCHEYGHALGLGHTNVAGATMFPSGSAGQTQLRSIAADDIAGVQSVYAVKAATKPTITAVSVSGTDVTIDGTNFDLTNNQVWFGPSAVTAQTIDPRIIVSAVTSTGTSMTVAIPAGAGDGDVFVRIPGTGGAMLSNAFPIDLP